MVAGLPESVKGPAVAVLRADVALLDRSTPTRVGRGRATRELEAALLKDPEFVAARMATAQLALDDGRQLDALEQARAAKTASPQPGAPVLQLIARVEMALGLDAAAALTAQAADQAMPGACDALLLQFDLARRRDAVKDSDVLLGSVTEKIVRHAPCPVLVVRDEEHDFA
jgi:nucleotide-binding universal stress UspA family protein